MSTRYRRFGGARKLLSSKSVESIDPPPDEEIVNQQFESTVPGGRQLLQRRSCLVIGEHSSADHQHCSESYLFSLLKHTLRAGSGSPSECGAISNGDSCTAQNGAIHLSLLDFAKLYQSKLPVTVQIYSSVAPLRTSPPPPAVDVLAMRDAPVVVCIFKEIQIFHLPLDANVQLAPLYDPCSDLTLAMVGMVFYGVNSILHSEPIPKLLCARSRWKHYDTTVQVGEIMVVKGPCIKGGKVWGLSLFSISTKTDKNLPLKCSVQFTTQPRYLCLSLSDIAAHIPDAFPCKACILGNDEGSAAVLSNVVTLNELTRASVLTCAVAREDQATVMCTVPVALPDVYVTVPQSQPPKQNEPCGQAHKEEEEVWEYADLTTLASAPLEGAAVATGNNDKQPTIVERQTAEPLPSSGQRTLKQTVGLDPDYEYMGEVHGDQPDAPKKRAPLAQPSAPPNTSQHFKWAAKPVDPDYEYIDGAPNTAIVPARGAVVADCGALSPSYPQCYRGTRRVDEDYEPMMEDSVFSPRPSVGTSAAPSTVLRRASDIITGAKSPPGVNGREFKGTRFAWVQGITERTREDYQGITERTREDYQGITERTREDSPTHGNPRPPGWIYMSGCYATPGFDEKTVQNGLIERCDSSVFFDDEYVDMVQERGLIDETQAQERS